MRGYNLSSRPDGVAAYDSDRLAADVRGLIHERGAESAVLVGHDWGGTAAWATAMNHPEVVDRLAILNAAHPRRLLQGLRTPRQLRKSWYFFYFQLPGLPERHVRARPLAVSSRNSCAPPDPAPIRRWRSNATSRRGHSQARQPR